VTEVPHSQQQIGHPDKNIKKETSELNDTIDQMNFTDTYRIFHQTAAEFIFSVA
jgi:hypothetical protein